MYARHAKAPFKNDSRGSSQTASATKKRPSWCRYLPLALLVATTVVISVIFTTFILFHNMNTMCTSFAGVFMGDHSAPPARHDGYLTAVGGSSSLLLQRSSNDLQLAEMPRGEYLSSLMMLRCFVTPDCFPRSRCRTGRPKKIKRSAKFEEQSFCVDDLRANEKKCIVYSFGILYSSVQWESKVAKFFGCEVHAFDPTMNHPRSLAPGVTFHQLGLEGKGTNMSLTNAQQYKPIDPTKLMQLDEIMKQLGHEDRELDVLMLDCEGCEWGVLKQLACSGQSIRVKQLVTEFHFQKNLGLYDETDVRIAADAVRCLWEERWNVVSIESSAASTNDWIYADGMQHVVHSAGMLLYIALQRTPDTEPHVSDLRHAEILEMQKLSEMMGEFRKKHGKNKDKWPDPVTKQVNRQRGVYQRAKRRAKDNIVQTVGLDTHPRLDETEWT